MNVILSNMKLAKDNVVRFTDLYQRLFQMSRNMTHKNGTTTLRSPNKMVPAIVNAMGGAAERHTFALCKS